jgi:cytochrome P450
MSVRGLIQPTRSAKECVGAPEPLVTAEQRFTGDRAVREFTGYLGAYLADRRRNPGNDNDLLSRLLRDVDRRRALVKAPKRCYQLHSHH